MDIDIAKVVDQTVNAIRNNAAAWESVSRSMKIMEAGFPNIPQDSYTSQLWNIILGKRDYNFDLGVHNAKYIR